MSIERMIRLAGEREMPSAEAMQRARAAAEESWRRSLARVPVRSRRWQWWLPLACAAALGSLLLVFQPLARKSDVLPHVVAQVAALQGDATVQDVGGATKALHGMAIHAGSGLVTEDGRVAAAIPGGLSLRLDRHTHLRFDDREHLTLLEGLVYVDSGGLNAGPTLSIRTPAGEVRHVGTQFQVEVSGQTTRVRVREGRVALVSVADTRAPAHAPLIAAGDALEIRGTEQRWQHGRASFGPEWEWATTLAQPLEIENRPLAEFLGWLAREHGWQLQYTSGALQQRTHEIRLHGSFDGLDTTAMLERTTMVTGVPLAVRDGSLWVGVR
jgi:ferric-dicitrate binding protein FerR (iron transport regulator)